MANRHQRTRIRLALAPDPRDGRPAAQPLPLDGAPLNQHVVERQAAVRVGFDGSLLCGESRGVSLSVSGVCVRGKRTCRR
jgi:hypothetical protein